MILVILLIAGLFVIVITQNRWIAQLQDRVTENERQISLTLERMASPQNVEMPAAAAQTRTRRKKVAAE